MRKPKRKTGNKTKKSDFEERFAVMVGNYHKAKEVLDSLEEGTAEYAKQKKQCDALFASAERFISKQ